MSSIISCYPLAKHIILTVKENNGMFVAAVNNTLGPPAPTKELAIRNLANSVLDGPNGKFLRHLISEDIS